MTHIGTWLRAAACTTALLATAADAEIYRWTDKDGHVQFGETPPKEEGIRSYEWTVDREKRIRDAKGWLPQVNFTVDLPELSQSDMKQDLLLLNTKAANGDKASISTLATYYLLGRGTPKNVDRALDIISRPEMSEAAIAYTLKVAIYTGAFGNEYFDLKQARAAALSGAALGEPLSILTSYAFMAHEANELFASGNSADHVEILQKINLATQLYELLAPEQRKQTAEMHKQLRAKESEIRTLVANAEATHRRHTWRRADRKARVSNSGWDGSVRGVEQYLAKTLHDPESLDVESWGVVQTNGTDYRVLVTYRAKNGFGAYRKITEWFYLTSTGDVYDVATVQ